MSFHIVLSLAPRSMAELFERADTDSRRYDDPEARPDLVEYRLEGFRDPNWQALCSPSETGVIATCRPEGFAGSDGERERLLAAALDAGAGYVDVEWASYERGFGRAFPLANLLLSHHGGGDLERLADAMASARPAVVKIVPEANGIADLPRLRALTARLVAHGVGACVFASGEKGVWSRVLTKLWGGWGTYVARDEEHRTAAGQLTRQEAVYDYRLRTLAPHAWVAGVAGWPLAHSRSPATHNGYYHHRKLAGVYVTLPTEDARELLGLARSERFRYLSITAPLKEAVMPLVDVVGDSARTAGAANTILREPDGRLRAENTDGHAVRDALLQVERALVGARVLVLGAGGAARAAADALATAGARVTLANRHPARAERAAKELQLAWAPWDALPPWDILVQATPAADLPLPAPGVSGRTLVEFIYARRTRMIDEAKALGLQIVSGGDIFARQAARQLELMAAVAEPGRDYS